MKAKKLAKMIRRGEFGQGLTPDQEHGAKASFLANLLVLKRMSFSPQEILNETSRARKLDAMLDILVDSGMEISDDDIKKAHCSMQTPWAMAVISTCLGYDIKKLTRVGLPPGYIAPLPAPKPQA